MAAAEPTTASGAGVQRPSGVLRATGRDREGWFVALDDWGAVGRPYREVAGWLEGEHGLSAWWAQKLVVEYEQARGVRQPGVRRDGTFAVTASKTVAVGAGRLFEAFADPVERQRWLPGIVAHQRAARPGRSVRFDWDGGESRVEVSVEAAGVGRTRVAVEHSKLPDARAAADRKAWWRARLDELKDHLEGGTR